MPLLSIPLGLTHNHLSASSLITRPHSGVPSTARLILLKCKPDHSPPPFRLQWHPTGSTIRSTLFSDNFQASIGCSLNTTAALTSPHPTGAPEGAALKSLNLTYPVSPLGGLTGPCFCLELLPPFLPLPPTSFAWMIPTHLSGLLSLAFPNPGLDPLPWAPIILRVKAVIALITVFPTMCTLSFRECWFAVDWQLLAQCSTDKVADVCLDCCSCRSFYFIVKVTSITLCLAFAT